MVLGDKPETVCWSVPALPPLVPARPECDPVRVTPEINALLPLHGLREPASKPGLVTRLEPPPLPVTVRTNESLAVRLPSETITVTVAEPVCEEAGVTDTVRLAPEPPKTMLAVGTSVTLEELPETLRAPAEVCASPIVKEIGPVVPPEAIVRSARLLMVGGVLAEGVTGSTDKLST